MMPRNPRHISPAIMMAVVVLITTAVAIEAGGQESRSFKINSAGAPLIGEDGSHVASGDLFGHSIAGIGDLDGDGNPDLAVGAPGTHGSSGAVWILMMREDGTVGRARQLSDGSDGLLSLRAGDGFGSAVAHLGDIDGDGTKDIAVGADGDDTAASNGGAVWILSLDVEASIVQSRKLTGITSGIDASRSGGFMTAMSTSAADRRLIAMEGACILDGLRHRCTWIWQLTSAGSLSNEVHFSPEQSLKVLSVGSAGDVDGNGVEDLLIGRFVRNRSAVDGGPKIQVVLLNTDGTIIQLRTLDSRDARYRILDDFTGPATHPPPIDPDSAYVPTALTSLKDLNGDGVSELVVGSYLGGGTVFEDPPPHAIPGTLTIMVSEDGVLQGTARATRQFASGVRPYDFNHDRSDRFGVSAANIGDLDNNGKEDLAVGADRDDELESDGGAVWIVMNPPLPIPSVASAIEGRSRPTSGKDLRIVARAENLASPVRDGTLRFRRAGDESYFALSMQQTSSEICSTSWQKASGKYSQSSATGDCFQAVIPAFAVSGHGIEYFVEMSVDSGPVGRSPEVGFKSVSVFVPEGYSFATSAGTSSDGYRLVSFPIQLEESGALELLETALGPVDKSRWRFFTHSPVGQSESRTTPAGTLTEVDGPPFMIEPGRGYWLLVRDAGRIIQTGPGSSPQTNPPFETEIGYGWNLIANPFAFDIALTQVFASSGAGFEALLQQGLVDILHYDGEWLSDVDSLRAGSGYALFVRDCLDDAVCNQSVSGRVKFFSNTSTDMAASTKSTVPTVASWAIAISARQSRVADSDNLAGVSPYASRGMDALDRPEPPVIGDYVAVAFLQTQWDWPMQRLRHDIRAPSDGYAWDFVVQSRTTAPVRLEFDDLDSVPDAFDIWLVDETAGIRQDLKTRSVYSLAGPGDGHERSLKLVVGETWFVDSELGEAPSVPQSLELSQPFPNPFSGATEFQVGIPESQSVSVDILDVLGRRVRTLATELVSRSAHEPLMWDGLTDSGRQAAAGVYLVRVEGVKRSLVRTVTLIR